MSTDSSTTVYGYQSICDRSLGKEHIDTKAFGSFLGKKHRDIKAFVSFLWKNL
jgi:hypothetical protein